jgi:predicted TPR repeat methyltransferase
VALRRERFDDAAKFVGCALELAPDVAAHHVTLGLIHKAKGEIGHAKKAYARALELDPQNDRARKAMAMIRPGRPSAKGGDR